MLWGARCALRHVALHRDAPERLAARPGPVLSLRHKRAHRSAELLADQAVTPNDSFKREAASRLPLIQVLYPAREIQARQGKLMLGTAFCRLPL